MFSDFISLEDMNQEKIQKSLVTFKQKNQHSYNRFHDCMELLDICTLDFNINKFFPVKIISAIIYIMVNKYFLDTNYEILPRKEATDDYEYSSITERLLQEFLFESVKIHSIESLIPAIQFIESFRNFPFQQDPERFSQCGSFVRNI